MLNMTHEAGVVLIVDDAPDNLALLHGALHHDGYTVHVATSGSLALDSARARPPNLILLDALMPGLDGFETCRRLKENRATRDIPVVFMTGLADTENVVKGFRAGGVDYVTKPVRPPEVLARIAVHLRNQRRMTETQQAADAAGDAIVAVDANGCLLWTTPMAQRWLAPILEPGDYLPAPVRSWFNPGADPAVSVTIHAGRQRLVFSRLPSDDPATALLLVRRHEPVPEPEVLMRSLNLTAREAEVLYWVALGKTNPEIAQILNNSRRTINKHMEHIFMKLGVETRTAATTLALSKGRLGVVQH
jgi:CheY-like chemotaxis protein/DNA-binding CsgD family transcriptional regulator